MVGHIKIDRKILNWEWYTDIKVFHLFLYLLLKANHKDGTWKGNDIKRGQVIIGRLKAAKDTGLTEREVRTCIEKLKTTNEIATKTTNKFTIVTICKYDFYQSNNFTKDQQIDQQNANKRPTKRQQTTTNKNDKEDKNDKEVFITMPTFEQFNGLPEMKVGAVIQLFQITKQTKVSKEDVNGFWNIFKIQNLTGNKFYKDEDAVYSHFINWVKTQRIDSILKVNSKDSEKQLMKDLGL